MARLGLVVAVLLMVSAGCARKRATVAPPAAPTAAQRGRYVDLQAGWRVVVITPLLKSGGYLLDEPRTPAAESGVGANSITLTIEAGPDFLGYEESRYAVSGARRSGDVRVRFESGESVREGKKAAVAKPKLPLFEGVKGARRVRLIYLLRSDQANHNMAIVGAKDEAGIEAITRRLDEDPKTGCLSRSCQWVPAGVAVRPEMRKAGDWVPVR